MQTVLEKRSKATSSSSTEKRSEKGVNTPPLMDLFEEQLKDVLWAEKALIKAFPKIIALAASDDLIVALMNHQEETHEQITRLAKVFRTIDKKPATRKCEAMEGLIAEASDMMKECEKGPECDAGIIAAVQKIDHCEIASYGTLRKFAETLGISDAEALLLKSLKEEKEADRKLTAVAAEYGVNMDIASSTNVETNNKKALL